MVNTTELSHQEDTSMADASPASVPTLPYQSRMAAAAQTAQTAEASASASNVSTGNVSTENKSFALSKDFKPAAVKLDNIERLEGQHNYEDWASQMAMVFDAMGVYDIVEGFVDPQFQHQMNSLSSNQLGETVSDIVFVRNNNQLYDSSHVKGHRAQPTTKSCTYCKCHGGRSEAHFWQDCKRDQKRKQAHAQALSSQTTQHTGLIVQASPNAMDLDLPNVPVSTSSHTYTWKLDTCASTHMTSEIELFEHLEPCDGTIRVGGDSLLLSEGIGTVLLNASLPNGSFHILRLKSVLYVPSLCHSLVSWTMLSEKGYVLTASGKFGFVSKDGCIVFMTELR